MVLTIIASFIEADLVYSFQAKLNIEFFPKICCECYMEPFLNYRIDMPDKIGSFSSGTTTSMEQKKLEVFFGSKHGSQKLL